MDRAMFRAALFDLDGLLVDSEPLWRAAEAFVVQAHGRPVTEGDCAMTSGLRLDEVIAHWLVHFDRPTLAREPIASAIVEELLGLLRAKAVAKPGAHELLARCRARGLTLAVASSSETRIITAALEALGLSHAFDAVSSAEHVALGKPHPEVVLRAAAALGADARACVVFEDSVVGVIAAKAARMACVAVPDFHQKGDPRYALADATLRSLADVDEALLARLERGQTLP